MTTRARGILFLDLDGTLVGEHGVAERVWAPLMALRDAGWRLSVCTGRPGRGVAMELARRLDADGLHVFESGGVVMDTAGRVHAHHPIAPDAVATIATLSRARGTTLEAYTADGHYLVPQKNPFIAAHEALLGFEAELSEWPPPVPLVRLQWVVPSPEWPALEAAAEPALRAVSAHEGRSPKVPGVSFISMTAPGVSKATGIAAVLAELGLHPSEAAMAGDNHNDLDGLRLVGTAFVPEDGLAEAMDLAHLIIPGPAHGGVAEAAMALLARG